MNKKITNKFITFSNNQSSWLIYVSFLLLSVVSVYFVLFSNEEILKGHDSVFHISRIEGLALALQSGDVFPRINYFFLKGAGYASSIFYADLFLYPAAVLRLIGINIPLSYAIYISMINFATFMISFKCFNEIADNRKKSFFFAVCYGLSSYRLSDVIVRAALGEVLAFMVLPIAFVGIIHVILRNPKKFYWLVIGMTLLFYSHMITSLIFCLFILLFMILNYKKLFYEKFRFKYLLYSALITLLLVANNLFPMIEQLFFQPLKFSTNPVYSIKNGAMNVGEYLWNALTNKGFSNIGIFILVAVVFLLIKRKNLSLLNKQLLGLSLVFMILSLKEFPQELFEKTIFNMVQFPWRYFIIVTICVSWVLADTIFSFNYKRQVWNKYLSIMMYTFLILSSVYFQFQSRYINEVTHIYSYSDYVSNFNKQSAFWLGAGSEYLPSSAEPKSIMSAIPDSEDTTISNYVKEYNSLSFDYSGANDTKIVVPFIYYKGYTAEIVDTGEELLVNESPYLDGYCEVTVSGSGSVKVQYKWTLVQKISFFITGITSLLFLCILMRNTKKPTGPVKRF